MTADPTDHSDADETVDDESPETDADGAADVPPPSGRLRVAAIQHDIVWEDAEATRERLVPKVTDAVAAGAGLVVLAEMFPTGFSMDTATVCEPPEGPSTAWMSTLAEIHGVHLAGSIPTADPELEMPVNRLVVASPDGTVATYDKIHPFSYGTEGEHYQGGDTFLVTEIDGVRLAWFVCYDLRFADEFWTLGPEVDGFVIPANWPRQRREHWTSLLRARAIENLAYVVGVNRVGKDGNGLDHAGDSMIIDPFGEVIGAAAGVETMLLADLSAARVAQVRERYPFLDDRS